MVNKIATSLRTDIMVDRQTAVWKLKDTELDVNGIRLDVNGAFPAGYRGEDNRYGSGIWFACPFDGDGVADDSEIVCEGH